MLVISSRVQAPRIKFFLIGYDRDHLQTADKGHFVPLVRSQAPSGEGIYVGIPVEGRKKLGNSSLIRSPRIVFILIGDDQDHLQLSRIQAPRIRFILIGDDRDYVQPADKRSLCTSGL